MKLVPVTKLGKRNKTMSKNFDGDVMSENCEVIDIFPITANLEQSGSRIPDEWSVKPIFSLIVTFGKTFIKNSYKISKKILQKLKTELKNL